MLSKVPSLLQILLHSLVPKVHLAKTWFYPLTHSCGPSGRNPELAASRPLAISKFGGSTWSIQRALKRWHVWIRRGWESAQVTSECGLAHPRELVRIWHCWLNHGAEVNVGGLTPQWPCYVGTILWPQALTSFQASFLVHARNKRETVDESMHIHHLYRRGGRGTTKPLVYFPKVRSHVWEMQKGKSMLRESITVE